MSDPCGGRFGSDAGSSTDASGPSNPCVIFRCRACCIRATLLTHSTRLLARQTPRSTARTRCASSCQSGHAFVSWTVRTNAQARVVAD